MPEGIGTQFPSLFTEQDKERLVQLQEQRKALEQAYKVKFSGEAWAGTPGIERAARRVTPPFLAPAIGALPGEAETFEYGFTPEQFQERQQATEEEFRELSRRQKTTRLLPNIQADMLLAALSGEPITETSELMSTFPELGQDFNEEEIGYLARMGQALSQATPEQIMSGELFASEPNQLPITQEDIDTLFRAGIQDPRNIYATVEFAKSVEEVSQALKQAYPSQVPEDEAREATRAKFREYFGGEQPSKEAITQRHAEIAEEEGKALTIVNEDTGELAAAQVKDGHVFIGDDYKGGYDEETGKVVPIDLYGNLIKQQEKQVEMLKGWWYDAALSLANAGYSTRQAALNIMPKFMSEQQGLSPEDMEKIVPGHLEKLKTEHPEEYEQYVVRKNQIEKTFREDYEKRETEHRAWLGELIDTHPEMAPRVEWDEPVFDRLKRNPKEVLDVGYLGHIIFSNVHTFLAAGVTIGTTLLTKNPWAGLAIGQALFTPLEIESLQADLMANGATYEQAVELAAPGGAVVASLEALGSLPLLSAVTPQFFGAFKANLQKELAKKLALKMVERGVLTPASIIVGETIEEGLQEMAHNAYVKTVNEDRSLLENVPESMIQAAIVSFPLGVGGAVVEHYNMKRFLPKEVQEEMDETTEKLEEAGLPKEQAEQVVYAEQMDTETGQAQVEEAIEKAEEQLPTSKAIQTMETRLSTYQEEIDARVTSNETFNKQLPGITIPTERLAQLSKIEDNEEKIVELQKEKKAILAKIERARKKLTKPAPTEITVESELASWQKERETRAAEGATREELTPIDMRIRDLTQKVARARTGELAKAPTTETAIVKPKTEEETAQLKDLGWTDAQIEGLDVEEVGSILRNKQAPAWETPAPEGRVVPEGVTFSTPEVAESAAIRAFNKMKTTVGRGGRIELTSTEVEALRIYIKEHGDLENRFFGVATKVWTGDTEVTIGVFPHEVQGVTGGEYLVYDINNGTFGVHGTPPSIEGKVTSPFTGETIGGVLTPEEFESRVKDWIAGKEPFPSIPPLQLTQPTPAPEVTEVSQSPMESGQLTHPFELEGHQDPLLPTRRPRTIDWEDELALEEASLKDPEMSKFIKLPKEIVAMRKTAETALNRLNDEFKAAKKSKDKEAIKEAEGKLKNTAKKAGLRSKALLGKRWDDLDPDTQKQLALSLLPDGSLEFKARKEFLDMEYFMEFLQELTGMPFYPLLRRIEGANAAAETAKELVLKRITNDPVLKPVRTSEESKERVSQIINSRNEAQGIEFPANATWEEVAMADAVEAIYNYYKPHVRYLRVMRVKSTKENFIKEFPDAVEDGKEFELEMALKLKEEGNLDDLWAYLFDKTWGVIEHGFDPRLIADPSLKVRRGGGTLEVTRGEGRLLRREAIEYPAGKMSKDVLARLASYVEQIELQWRIEPELDTFNDYWNQVNNKFSDWGDLKRGLDTWVARIQNIGLGYNWADRQVRRLWRQAMASVFLEPYMGFRNSWQAILFHPDRTELFRIIKEHLPDALSQKADLYFNTFVSQLGGLRKDWLQVGERGFLPESWNRLADSLSLYGWSDHFPRLWSFKAALAKANRATQQYLKDGDVSKWLKNSGVIHLRDTEKNFALNYLNHASKTFDTGINGLRDIQGPDMASFYIAQRIADMTHFKYRRSTRGLLEMGVTGSTLWNLIVFSRGYGQRLYFQGEKIKNTFAGETSWNEARTGFNDIMKLVLFSSLAAQLFSVVTGRRRNPWNPLNVLFGWQFGGLFVGIAQDVSIFIGSLATILNPLAADEDRDLAWGRLPMLVERIPETLVPFFRRASDLGETIINIGTGKDVKTRQLVRLMRGWLDENYTPAKLDELDMNFWETMRKVILGGQPVDPTELEEAMKSVDDAQGQLGTYDVTGRYFTLGDLGSKIASETKEIPTIFMSEQEGWSDLILFYKDSETQWDELYTLPAGAKAAQLRGTDERSEWRKNHVLEEAMLLFWEKYSVSVFRLGSPEAEEVKSLLKLWFDQYNIDQAQHSHWASWTLPAIPLTTEQ